MRRLWHIILVTTSGALLITPGCSREVVITGVSVESTDAEQVGKKNNKSDKKVEKSVDKDRLDKEKSDRPYSFPPDEGGALLKRILPPQSHAGALKREGRKPQEENTVTSLRTPQMVLPRTEFPPPRLPVKNPSGSRQPYLVQPETLPTGTDVFLAPLALPTRPPFYAGELVRERGTEVEFPPPLPTLGRPLTDRVPLDDPTLGASLEAALTAPLPVRTTPVPYERLRIPEPFPLRQPLQLPLPPEVGTPPGEKRP